MSSLPIEPILPELLAALDRGRGAVLQAPPGAGKTTRVPLALLGAGWLGDDRILVLEPRRLAARAAARRMAAMLGEPVGETVGYAMRMERRAGPRTRIEVVTEGVLTRRLQRDPSLAGVGAVLFDEFHERSLQADLGLALCREVQAALRDDLRLLVMSATLDGAPVARLLGDAPILTSEGRSFPVAVRYLDREPQGPRRDSPRDFIEQTVAAAVLRALDEESGSLLVFLPGEAEIRRVQARLEAARLAPEVRVAPLYGALPPDRQDEAIRPAPPGGRKVVLATAIAETSLTIEGIRIVIDAGLMRVPRFDPRSGLTRLETVRVSQASAEQRRGRAGRLAPGVCYRLWTEAAQGALVPFGRPEILEADLSALALELAQWGVRDPADLAWLDPPPEAAFAQACDLLADLGALDGQGRITAQGRAMASLGLHPRLAHMVLEGQARGLGGLACDVAALLEDRDILRNRDADLRARLEILQAVRRGARGALADGTIHHGALERALQAARLWRRRIGVEDRAPADNLERTGLLVGLAYPDRIAKRRAGSVGGFLLGNGRGAILPPTDPLAAADWLAVAALDGAPRNAAIFLAAPLTLPEIEDGFADRIRWIDRVEWDGRAQAVVARREQRFGALVLRQAPLAEPDPARQAEALLDGVRQLGLEVLPWTADLRAWCARVGFLRRIEGAVGWPDLSTQALLDDLDTWLGPHLHGLTRIGDLKALDLAGILRERVDWAGRRHLEDAAPTHLTVPSGSRIRVDYTGEVPVLAVRLQEMFGAARTPAVAGGRVPVLLHLLSPAGRPVQVTRDLASFWADGYRSVKADLKGRYPKHFWPDDPLAAPPTRRAKPRSP